MDKLNEHKDKKHKGSVNVYVGIIIAFSALILISLMAFMWFDGYRVGGDLRLDATGQFGDYIGGVLGTLFSGAAFWLLYLTLKHQNATAQRQSFDDQFSKMLLIGQQNIEGMRYDASKLLTDKDKLYIAPRLYSGKDVFQVFFFQFLTCRNELKPIFGQNRGELYTLEYRKIVKDLPLVKTRKIDINTLAKIDICYSVVFFGANSIGRNALKEMFKNRYNAELIERILEYIALKPAFDKKVNEKWQRLESCNPMSLIAHLNDIYNWRKNRQKDNFTPVYPELSVDYRSDFVKYYSGFHNLLGHYFRHLYQSVKYVDVCPILNDDEKYDRIKLLRGQMSNYEQVVFFLNSLSNLGRVWELAPDYEHNDQKHYDLVTHYKLIKNVPAPLLFEIDIKHFYPDIVYEISG